MKADRRTPEKQIGFVRDIFSTIGARYDFLNHVLSVRRDVFWRRFTAQKLRFLRTFRFLDLATGTADLAIEAARHHHRIQITGIDFAIEMIDLGKEKIKREGLSSRIDLVRADAMNLPFPSCSFDAAGIAFGIRNIPEKAKALCEMARVVVSGGQIMVLEMTMPEKKFISDMYNIYLNRMLPWVAALFSPNPDAYRYLGHSIMNFPKPADFARLMSDSGLKDIKIFPLSMGIAHLYTSIAG